MPDWQKAVSACRHSRCQVPFLGLYLNQYCCSINETNCEKSHLTNGDHTCWPLRKCCRCRKLNTCLRIINRCMPSPPLLTEKGPPRDRNTPLLQKVEEKGTTCRLQYITEVMYAFATSNWLFRDNFLSAYFWLRFSTLNFLGNDSCKRGESGHA